MHQITSDVADAVRAALYRHSPEDWDVTVTSTTGGCPSDLKRVEVLVRPRPSAPPGATASPPAEGPVLLTKQEVADRLKVSVRTVDTLVAEGAIARARVRGQVRFTEDSLRAYLRTATGRGAL